MHVLVFNPGSATLKVRLIAPSEGRTLEGGLVEDVHAEGQARAAVEWIDRLRAHRIDAIGCRVVHGGERFTAPTRVTPQVLDAIRDLGRLAPLHNPTAAAVLAAVAGALPDVPLVAVFDTAFHRTLPDVAALYALPLELSRRLQLRRYGFHGLSHQFVSARLIERLGRPAAGTRVITCHLGNGCSLCAVRAGQSIDTSMGLTPLEGLVMGSRAGDIDPGLLLHLQREHGYDEARLDALLNAESGLLGVGGSRDLRQLQARADAGAAEARLAIELFAYRVRKYIGAYAAALEGVDALAFTGGIGEHSSRVRGLVCTALSWLGVRLDPVVNEQPGDGEVRLSAADSAVQVWRIPTDEERLVAEAVAGIVR